MKIEKIGNKYRVRKQINGIKYTFTFDSKPTQKMLQQAMDKRNIIKKQGNTFRACSNAYIDAKQNVLSPTTINGYKGIIRQLSEQLMNKDIGEITQLDVQKEINNYAKNHSPKSTKNLHSFISSVLSLYRNDIHLRTHLPMNIKKTPYIPTREDIKTIMEESYNTKYEIPLKLACLGLRRSEICALTKSDIKGNKVYINKTKVKNTDGKYIIKKTTKTSASTRIIYISDELKERIKVQGLYNGSPEMINQYLSKIIKKHNIPHFSLHKLRHYFVSKLNEAGVDDATIMSLGGYETDHIMKSVYRHSLANEQKKKEIIQKADLF